MQVTVDYREEQPVFGNKAKLYVDVGVQFSEEEKAIIRSRSLEDYFLPFDAGVAPQTAAGFLGAGAAKGFGALCIVIAFVSALFNASFSGYLVFFGIGLVAWGYFSDRKGLKAAVGQDITLKRLLRNPKFSIFAANHAEAQRIEEDIRTKLTVAKNFIMSNAAPATSHSYQL